MTVLPGLTFAAPWVLALLAGLPLLWRLMRVIPPRPRTISFPALSLLLGLGTPRRQAEATPFWLLLLRLLLAALLILAAAGPRLVPQVQGRSDGPLLVVMDDGWAAARDWDKRRAHLDGLLAAAERLGRPVMLIPTAPPADGGPVTLGRLSSASEARALAAGMEPKPWPTDRKAVLAALDSLPFDRAGSVVWLGDGLADPVDAALARRLQGLGGGLEIVTGSSGRLLLPPKDGIAAERLAPVIRRLPSAQPEDVAVRALDAKGIVLARGEARFEPGTATAETGLDLPSQLRNRLARLEIEGERGAGSVLLLDGSSRRRAIGLAGGEPSSAPLLDRLYYVDRALAPHAELRRGELAQLAADPALDMVILADVPLAPGPAAALLAARVEQGTVLVRFAGPLQVQAAQTDPLLPVTLLAGGRALGGVLSWTTPMRLAPFPETSPFHGLAIPEDVEIRSQVLAEPDLGLGARTWASLADGTPLVTALRKGRGMVVLIHTSANAEWGNLALSGLFVDMLRQLATLSQGGTTQAIHPGPLAPAELLDGLGRLAPAAGISAPLNPASLGATLPQPRHPPGFYGPAEARIAFNLGPVLPPATGFSAPPGATLTTLGESVAGVDFAPVLLLATLILALADMTATLALRGLLWRAAALIMIALLGPQGGARAESFALEAGLATRLACVTTRDAAMDRLCLAGLRGLSARLAERSTAELAEPMLVDPERDPVVFFPLLYWRITPQQPQPSPQAVEKLNTYMARGGVILVDTGDEGQAGAGPDTAELERLRRLVAGLALPPLVPMARDHVLTRSFYLLKGVPGRWDGATLWVSQDLETGNDGVSPVVLGGNDWMAAWAVDERDRPLHAVVPGGERQREMAYRFGINLVMYALTGNYKADQVHLPAIMDRLKR